MTYGSESECATHLRPSDVCKLVAILSVASIWLVALLAYSLCFMHWNLKSESVFIPDLVLLANQLFRAEDVTNWCNKCFCKPGVDAVDAGTNKRSETQ